MINFMEKDFEVDFLFSWDFVKLKQVRKDIQKLEKMGATHIRISTYREYGDNYVRIEAISRREETEQEKKQRIKSEKELEEKNKQEELKQLEYLRNKYQV